MDGGRSRYRYRMRTRSRHAHRRNFRPVCSEDESRLCRHRLMVRSANYHERLSGQYRGLSANIDLVVCRASIPIEHVDGFKRVRIEVFPDEIELAQYLRNHRNDVTAGIFCLKDIQQLPRTCP